MGSLCTAPLSGIFHLEFLREWNVLLCSIFLLRDDYQLILLLLQVAFYVCICNE